MRRALPSLLAAALGGCAVPSASAAPPADGLTMTAVALPGGDPSVLMDYLACEPAARRVWIPAGNTGSVDLLDGASGAVTRIAGFPTRAAEWGGRAVRVGPSAVTVGDGVVYIGNRGDGTVCAIDAKTLARGKCAAVGGAAGIPPSQPDGVAYVAATKEVWVTLREPPGGGKAPDALAVLDAANPSAPAPRAAIAVGGEPEGYAVDDARGLFYTNLEDKDRTLAVDARARRVVATWEPRCGGDGPRGLALDGRRGFLFVACTDHVVVLDAGHGGARLDSAPTGAGVDNIDYVGARGELYVAAGRAAKLSVFRVDDRGRLAAAASAPTAPGARVVVADGSGAAYVADSKGGRILRFTPAR